MLKPSSVFVLFCFFFTCCDSQAGYQILEDESISPNKEAIEFLEQNMKRSDVNVFPNGVQYRVERSGLGLFHPFSHALCKLHYEGHTRNGTRFDSSYARDRMVKTRPDHLVPGLESALLSMVEGDLWEIFIPPEHGYNNYDSHAHDNVDHSDVTIYKIWLIEIIGDTREATDRCDVESLDGCNEKLKHYIESSKSKYKTVERMKVQLGKLEKQLVKGTANDELKDWLHAKIHALELLIQHREKNDGFDNKKDQKESGARFTSFSSDEL